MTWLVVEIVDRSLPPTHPPPLVPSSLGCQQDGAHGQVEAAAGPGSVMGGVHACRARGLRVVRSHTDTRATCHLEVMVANCSSGID